SKVENLQLLDNEINAAGMVDHVIIYSNYIKQLHTLKQIDPALTVWYKSIDDVPPISDVQDLNGVMLPVATITKDVVDEFHAAGLTVMRSRALENDRTWKKFVKTGADGLMTDNPPLIIEECRALP